MVWRTTKVEQQDILRKLEGLLHSARVLDPDQDAAMYEQNVELQTAIRATLERAVELAMHKLREPLTSMPHMTAGQYILGLVKKYKIPEPQKVSYG